MGEILIVTFSLASIVTALALAKTTMGRSWVLSPTALYAVVSVTFVNLGFIFFFMENNQEPWALRAVLAVSLGLVMVTAGGALGVVLISGLRKRWPRLPSSGISIDIPFSVAVTGGLIGMGISGAYFVLLGYIPLVEALRLLADRGFVPGLMNTFRVARDVYVNPDARYIPLQGLLEMVRYFGMPVIVIWFLHFYRQGRHRFVSLSMLMLASLVVALTGQRWPLMYLLVSLLLYWTWTESSSLRLLRAVFSISLIAIVLGVSLSVLLGRQADYGASPVTHLAEGVGDLGKRILTGNVVVPFRSYSIFPAEEDWLYGGSWAQNLKAYLPGPSPSYPVIFYQRVTGDHKGFTAPPDFYTESYINFGFGGVLGLSFLWGLVLAWLQLKVIKKHRSLLQSSILAMLVALVGFSAISGISFLVGGIIVSVLIVVLLFGVRIIVVAIRGQAAIEEKREGLDSC